MLFCSMFGGSRDRRLWQDGTLCVQLPIVVLYTAHPPVYQQVNVQPWHGSPSHLASPVFSPTHLLCFRGIDCRLVLVHDSTENYEVRHILYTITFVSGFGPSKPQATSVALYSRFEVSCVSVSRHRDHPIMMLTRSTISCTTSPLVDPSGTPAPCATHADTTANATVTPSFTIPSTTAVPTASPCVGSTNSSGAQTSLTLLSSVIAANFAQNGLNTNTSEAGEVASLTSSNNFINFCATLPDLPITNGQQLKNGSCNPAPMGAIPSASNIPSAKFVTPANLAVIPSNVTFQVILAVRNLAAGYFVNPDTNFLAAPQQLDPSTGLIQGHTHIVIEALQSLNQTTPTDPTKFAFFLGLNSKVDASGQLYANVTGGLPKGTYRMSTLTAAMNHQPVVLPVAQRGVSDDTIYVSLNPVLIKGRIDNLTYHNSSSLLLIQIRVLTPQPQLRPHFHNLLSPPPPLLLFLLSPRLPRRQLPQPIRASIWH